MVTPRYFAAEALSSSTLCKMYLVFSGLTFLVMWRTWHLEGLNCIFHIFSHCSRHARSVCRTWPSVVELIARYMAVSSAKSLTLDLTCSGRSFMYARKRTYFYILIFYVYISVFLLFANSIPIKTVLICEIYKFNV